MPSKICRLLQLHVVMLTTLTTAKWNLLVLRRMKCYLRSVMTFQHLINSVVVLHADKELDGSLYIHGKVTESVSRCDI